MRPGLGFAVLFQLAFSLAVLRLVTQQLPFGVLPVMANKAPVEAWYPSGPALDYLVPQIYIDLSAEYTGMNAGLVDLMDMPLDPPHLSSYLSNSNYYVASAPQGSISGIDFNLANNFWGCDFNYSSTSCGVEIRQGIAHLLDKVLFSTDDSAIAGAIPIDNPAGGEIPQPNPCNWDATHIQTGPNCVVGEGTASALAYHLAPAVPCGLHNCKSTPTHPWSPGFGTPDFCAAADHFIAAGLATGKDGGPGTGTCQLTGITGLVTGFPVDVFARSDNPALNDLGQSIAQELCALFTGTFSTSCQFYVTLTQSPITAFPGFTGSPTQANKSWWIYTSGSGSYSPPNPFSEGLDHFTQIATNNIQLAPDLADVLGDEVPEVDSALAEGGAFPHPLCATNVPTYAPSNYASVCNPAYDSVANTMLSAPCLSAPGDPQAGQVTPTFGYCPGTSQFTVVSQGYRAENIFGSNTFAIPVFVVKPNLAYLSNWSRMINGRGGVFNYFSWLNAYSPTPKLAGTVRQGFSQAPESLNPYTAETPWDVAIVRAIYDSPGISNPLRSGQGLDWMTISTQVLTNGQLTYTPPVGTIVTYRFSLRNDLFWQDGRKVTAWDAKFSYSTLRATGSVFGSTLLQMVCNVPSCVDGIDVMSTNTFDVHVKQNGIGTGGLISSVPIIPGRYWAVCPPNPQQGPCCSGSAWDNSVAGGKVSDSCMNPDGDKKKPSYDPLATGILVGSGPWLCKSSGGVIGLGCSSTGTQIVTAGGTFTLSRYGIGTPPAGSNNIYFRSNGNLALYIWTGDTGDFNHDFLNYGVVSNCFGQPLQPLGSTNGCGHWQQGIGAPGGHSTVGLTQVSVVQRFVGVNWVSPYDWANAPPEGIASLAPVLYEGSATLNPASVVGCMVAYAPTLGGGGYDC